jgi:hypothetical protein
MTRIVLTEEQAKLLSPIEAVEICDPQGHVLVVLPPELTPEELARIPRAKDYKGPWYTGAQVRDALQFLEEARRREGPFGQARTRELLNQWRAERS